MKKSLLFGILATFALFSCSKEEDATPLNADFTAEVTGEAPNAQLSITNNSTGASSYSWAFGEGASTAAATEASPSIVVDKAGDLTITLIARNGAAEKTVTKTVSVSGHSAIITYSDVEFAVNAGDDVYGRLFSFETGRMYKDSEVTAENGSKIHLGFGSMANTMYYFDSPAKAGYNIPNANIAKVVNWESTPRISAADFTTMTDDRKLSVLTIEDANDSFGNSSVPGTVLFETSTGQKGVIHTKAVNSSRLLVDIKIQKY